MVIHTKGFSDFTVGLLQRECLSQLETRCSNSTIPAHKNWVGSCCELKGVLCSLMDCSRMNLPLGLTVCRCVVVRCAESYRMQLTMFNKNLYSFSINMWRIPSIYNALGSLNSYKLALPCPTSMMPVCLDPTQSPKNEALKSPLPFSLPSAPWTEPIFIFLHLDFSHQDLSNEMLDTLGCTALWTDLSTSKRK